MSEASGILRSYVSLVRRLSGAASVSLYVPPGPAGEREILVHDGRLDPLPELADPASAAELHGRPGSGPTDAGEGAARLASRSAGGVLCRIPLRWVTLRAEEDATGPERRRRESPRSGLIAWIGMRFEAGTHGAPPGRAALGSRRRGRHAQRRALVEGLSRRGRRLCRPLAHPLPVAVRSGDRAAGSSGVPGRAGGGPRPRAGDEAAGGASPARPGRLRVGQRAARPAFRATWCFGRSRPRSGPGSGATITSPATVARPSRSSCSTRRSTTAGSWPRTFCARLSDQRYHGGILRLEFSAGVAAADPGNPVDAPELVRRADQALSAAKRGSAGSVRVWEKGSDVERARSLDRLQGIFTGDKSTDYRNMRLLLDSVAAVAAATDPGELARGFTERLFETLHARRVGVLERSRQGGFELLGGLERVAGGTQAFRVTEQDLAIVDRACREGDFVADGRRGAPGHVPVRHAARAPRPLPGRHRARGGVSRRVLRGLGPEVPERAGLRDGDRPRPGPAHRAGARAAARGEGAPGGRGHRPAARGARLEARLPLPGHRLAPRHDAQGGAHRHHRPHHRRERHGQGDAGLDRPRAQRPPRAAHGGGRLQRDLADAHRERAVRARARGLHRGPRPQAGPVRPGRRLDRVPRRDRRAAAGPAEQAPAVRPGQAVHAGGRGRGRRRSTCGSSPPRTSTSGRRWPRAGSARTSSTA